jgi:hypothetical protein
LALDDVIDIPETAPTQFSGIFLNYGDDDGTCSVKLSGSFSLDGETYTITDLEAPINTSGIGLNMPTAVDTSTGQVPVVRIIFDLDNCVQANKSATALSGPWVQVPGTSDIWVSVQELVFVPYVGNTEPTVRKYKVELTDAAYSPDQWYLKLVTYFDGDLMSGAGFQMVCKSGATLPPGADSFVPGMLYFPALSLVGTGVWKIDTASYARGPGSRIAFPAFDLNGGSGTLKYTDPNGGGAVTQLEYAATELQ